MLSQVELNHRGGHQTGPGEPSTGGSFSVVFFFFFFFWFLLLFFVVFS